MKLKKKQLRELIQERASTLPEGAAGRVIIAKGGGLAYPLFGLSFSRIYSSNSDFLIPGDTSRGRLNLVIMYSNAVQHYVDDAEQHARDHDFGLVYIKNDLQDNKRSLFSDFAHNNVPIYRFGVGKTAISSVEVVERFCNMIKSGHERFEERYTRIKKLAELLKDS